MDGARQIVIPATVSLLCICIVFVPMFNLGGVAGYLFRPMAEAVVFALVGSYVLSRTLVNTMARFLLAHQAAHGHGAPRPPTRNPFSLFQRGFERRFEAARAFYRRLLVTALAARGKFIVGFLVAVVGSFALAPYLGQNFFPPVANTQLKLHVRAPTGTRIEDTALICDGVEAAIRRIVPARGVGSDRRQHRIAGERHQFHLQQFGHGRPRRRRYPDHHQARVRERGRRLHQADARDPAEIVSGYDLRLPAGRHRLPDSQFRPSRADRRPDRRLEVRRQPHLRQQASAKDRPRPRRRGRSNPTGVKQSDAWRRGRPHARRASRLERSRHRPQPAGKSVRQFQGGADVLDQPEEWRSLSDRRADSAILARFDVVAREHSRLARRRFADPRRPGDAEARREPLGRLALRGPAGPRHLRDQQ